MKLPIWALFTTYGVVNVKFFDSILALAGAGEITQYAYLDTVVRPRNMDTLIKHFLEGDGGWAFFTAADIEIPAGTVRRLHELATEHDYKAITPVAFSHSDSLGVYPAFWHRYDFDTDDSQLGVPESDEPVVDIEACGCYSLLVHREALEAVENRWGEWFVGDQDRPSDHVFSSRLGQITPIGLVPDLRVHHWRSMRL